MSLTVLLTNIVLSGRSGTEIQTRNIALELARRGHRPIVYSPESGPIADELRRNAVAVSDDINSIACAVDIIHAHHTPTAATAIARFPDTPAVFLSHDFTAWHDVPPRLPSIRRYLAVDATVADRLRVEHGIAAAQLHVLFNQPDIERFRRGPPLPETPRRALAFAKNSGHIDAVAQACAQRDIELDIVGPAAGRTVDDPETLIPRYDLVFTSALSAMEALACGRAVVVCDGRGLAGMLDNERYSAWRHFNFGLRTLRNRPTAAAIDAEIDRYDAAEAARVAERMRAEGGMRRHCEELVALYHTVIAEHAAASIPTEAMTRALADHLQTWSPRYDRRWPWMQERRQLLDQIETLQRPLPPLVADKPMSFSEISNRHWARTARGFSLPEHWGIWTDGREALLILRVAPLPRGEYSLRLTLTAFTHARQPQLQANILLNGASAASWTFDHRHSEPHERRLDFHSEQLLDDGELWLHFLIEDARSPHELGINADKRRLGLGLHCLELRSKKDN